ncbi:hypothetical protein LO762_14520 [Actinocorallia sp. API 0066]|uniref:hypothetical protein n=1 Tax=Actinocorallia sp. API 0066 TaxID=2896846 RepID=UPI001E50247A|nr:hypothetical protein [Actinocorallia sp. API 0066]MCD0450397.1 hypothetical protein [Actinocorallia sp. API 0066]
MIDILPFATRALVVFAFFILVAFVVKRLSVAERPYLMVGALGGLFISLPPILNALQ